MYKYYFDIIEADGDAYTFEGFFEDHFEADAFIQQNEDEGNIVSMVYPFIEPIGIESVIF